MLSTYWPIRATTAMPSLPKLESKGCDQEFRQEKIEKSSGNGTSTFTSYGTWSRTRFCISSAGVALQPVMQKIQLHFLLPFKFDVLYYGGQSRDDTI